MPNSDGLRPSVLVAVVVSLTNVSRTPSSSPPRTRPRTRGSCRRPACSAPVRPRMKCPIPIVPNRRGNAGSRTAPILSIPRARTASAHYWRDNRDRPLPATHRPSSPVRAVAGRGNTPCIRGSRRTSCRPPRRRSRPGRPFLLSPSSRARSIAYFCVCISVP